MAILFDSYFKETILERGYRYYLENRVVELELGENRVVAVVEGTDFYNVRIEFEDWGITFMSCDCPYFAAGNNCKHLVAVFFTLREHDVKQRFKTEKDILIELLLSLRYEELMDFLVEELYRNGELRFHLKTRFQHKLIQLLDYPSFLNYIDSLFDFYVDSEGFVAYEQVIEFKNDLENIVDVIFSFAVEGGYSLAFEVTMHLVDRLRYLEIKDSWGIKRVIMQKLLAVIQRILQNCTEPLHTHVYQWLCLNVYGQVIYYLEDDFLLVFMERFYLDEKFQLLLKKLILAERIKEPGLGWIRQSELVRWLCQKLNSLLDAGDYTKAEAVIKQYLYISEVSDLAINWNLANRNYQQAIDLLIAGKKQFTCYPGVMKKYSKQLIELYQLTGNHKALVTESRTYLLEYSTDLKTYKEHRSLFSSADWEKERQVILAEFSQKELDLKPYYAEEGMLDQLLAEIKNDPHYTGLDTYEEILYPYFGNILRDLFKARVCALVQSAKNRSHYRRIGRNLERLSRYPGGKQIVGRLKSQWKEQYRNRPAMLEELKLE